MEKRPVPENDHGLAAVRPGREILSIQFRLDGLSCARAEADGVVTARHGLSADDPAGALRALLASPEWPRKEFAEVKVCVPTHQVLLIPAEGDREAAHKDYFRFMGFETSPAARIFAAPIEADEILLHAVCEALIDPLEEKFGEKLSFFHPLAVNLQQKRDTGALLQIDGAGGYANISLTAGADLLFADVLPAADGAGLLLAVNRIVVAHKTGAFRIVCSGENSSSRAAILARHYRQAGVHPDGENRNLIFPLR